MLIKGALSGDVTVLTKGARNNIDKPFRQN